MWLARSWSRCSPLAKNELIRRLPLSLILRLVNQVKMAFGDSVAALLETYSNCLKLLKAFGSRKRDGADASNESLLLRKAIKSDRTKVRRSYSSRLSEAGSRLEKGDGPARSSLRRILRRLAAAVADILNASRKRNPALDYESLMSLSNASRADAIRAIDQLSRRLGSTSSRGSVASSSKPPKHGRHRPSGSSAGSSTSTRMSRDEPKSHRPAEISKDLAKAGAKAAPGRRSEGAKRGPHESGSERRSRTSSGPAASNRLSLMTISTDSTKLGEIPHRKSRRRHEHDTASDEYNISPTYPLKPYQPPEVKEGRFWGLFRR